MSLIRKLALTPARVAANRRNALRSTGPKTAKGKARSAVNACHDKAYTPAVAEAMRALGEDPNEFRRLYEGLSREWRPRSATCRRLVRQLAELMWKLDRLGRAERGLAASRLERLERDHACGELLVSAWHISEPKPGPEARGLAGLPDTPAKFERMLALLTRIRAAARRHDAREDYAGMLFELFGHRKAEAGSAAAESAEGGVEKSATAESPVNPEPPGFPSYDSASTLDDDFEEMERGAERLIERTKSEYEAYRLSHQGLTQATRDAELAPRGKKAVLLIRRENSLMRQIERTVRLLLLLGAGDQEAEQERGQGEQAAGVLAGSRTPYGRVLRTEPPTTRSTREGNQKETLNDQTKPASR